MTKRLFAYTGITMLATFTVVFYFGFYGTLAVFAFALILSVCAFVVKPYARHRSAILAVAVASLLSVVYFNIFTAAFFSDAEPFDGKKGYCEAVVTEIPREKYGDYYYELKSENILGINEKQKIQLISDKDLKLSYGDEIGFLGEFRVCNNKHYNSFGYKLWANISDDSDVNIISDKSGELRFLPLVIREKLSAAIGNLINSPEAEVCKSVTLGEKYVIPDELRVDFSESGLSYIIVVSGMHLSIISAVVIFLLSFVGSKRKSSILNFIIATPLILLYAGITGMYAPVVRSAVMVILSLFGACIMRKSDNFNNLGFAAFLITIINPMCVGNIGVLMSFASVLSLIYFHPKLSEFYHSKFSGRIKKESEIIKLNEDKKLIAKSKRRLILYSVLFRLIDYFLVSCCASLAISPITLINFGSCNLSFVLTSLLVAPVVAVLMICTLAAAILFYIPYMSIVAEVFAYAAEKVSLWIISVVRFAAGISFTKLYINPVFVIIWLVIFAGLVFVAMHFKNRSKTVSVAVAISILLSICFGSYAGLNDRGVSLNIINSGKGITALVKGKDRNSVLCCGGNYLYRNKVLSELHYSAGNIDFLTVPSNDRRESNYADNILNEFDVKDLLMYYRCADSGNMYELASKLRYRLFNADTEMELKLDESVSDYLVCKNGHTWQYIKGESSVLLAPENGVVSELPKKFRNPDYLVLTEYTKEYEKIDYSFLVLPGKNKHAPEDKLITAENGTVSIDLR